MATESLLATFPPVSTDQWERVIRETVQGPDYAEKLIWHPEEGLAVRPYYRAEDISGLPFLNALPGDSPYVRGSRRDGGWRIREDIDAVDPEEANRRAIEAVTAGAEEVAFLQARMETESDLAILLANLNEIPVHFASADARTVGLLSERLKKRPHSAGVSADLDPFADLEFSAEAIRSLPQGLGPFTIDAGEFHEHAAGAIEEVSFALSAAVDFVAAMQDRSLPIDSIAGAISFSFAAGPEFFVQIAKLRAFRMVWAEALTSFGASRETAKTTVHARPSYWDKTVYDRHVNVLRATTETISAILGGADSISIAPFDECCQHPDESSRRLARNTQLILKHEALLDRVADPVGGSYLIESLSNAIAAKAWKLFQELESAGGYRKARAAGVFAAVFERRLKARDESVAVRRRAITGTNRFADVSEAASACADLARMDASPRAARRFEQLRLNVESHQAQTGGLPLIVLAEIGDAKMRSARSQFVADFLACAGLECEVQRFEQPEQIAAADADVIVLCSSDPEYLPITRDLIAILRDKNRRGRNRQAIVIVAGNPDNAGQLGALGVAHFIHLRSNVIAVLTALLEQMGIKE
jgi:methylmalonyl-CoA mutase